MLDAVFKVIETTYDYIKPWQLIDQYEEGVLLRWGKFKRTLKPGLHWKCPVADRALSEAVIPDIINLDEQSLATDDDKRITISCIVSYHIHNIEKALLRIQDVEDATADACYGGIGMVVADNRLGDMNTDEFRELMRAECHKITVKFGVTIDSVRISNLCETTTFRHFGVNLG